MQFSHRRLDENFLRQAQIQKGTKPMTHFATFGLLVTMFVFFIAIQASGEKKVGEVDRISGIVSIDACGTGNFIRAEAKDAIYDNTIFRTESDSEVRLLFDNEEIVIPSETEFKIESVHITRTRVQKLGWFSSAINFIKRIINPFKSDSGELVLCSRAAESESVDYSWAFDEEDETTLFHDSFKLIDQGRYTEAILKLNAISFSPEEALLGEIAYLKEHALYELVLYETAIAFFEQGYQNIEHASLDIKFISFYEPLLFELGVAHYMMGNHVPAEMHFRKIKAHSESDLLPFSPMMLTMTLKESGKTGEADRIAEEAVKKYRNASFETDFAELISTER